MRKITKAPIFIAALATMLTSCGTDSIAGTYGFQMGKETGTHFGIYLTLKDKKYVSPDPAVIVNEKSKECEFKFSIKFGDETDIISSFISVVAEILGQEGNKITIPGYYYKGTQVDEEGAIEIKLGVDFSFMKTIFDGIDDMPDISFPQLDPDTIEQIVYTTYLNNIVTVNIPVSELDALYQLYWYGVDFNVDGEGKLVKNDTPFEGHKPGSHPTAEDVKTINETYNYKETHKQFFETLKMDSGDYRDYYTLAMGLVKA